MIMRNLMLLIVSFGSLWANAQKIDSDNSNVAYAVRNMKVRTVEGTFTGMTGTIRFDENNLSDFGINVCLDANSVNTDNEKRDEHLKKEDFFDVDQFPEICFVSNSILKKEDAYIVEGALTLHGVTKTINIPLVFKNNTVSGTFTVERKDYELGPSGGFMIGKDIQITINCQLL